MTGQGIPIGVVIAASGDIHVGEANLRGCLLAVEPDVGHDDEEAAHQLEAALDLLGREATQRRVLLLGEVAEGHLGQHGVHVERDVHPIADITPVAREDRRRPR